jgi:hypothetical protein
LEAERIVGANHDLGQGGPLVASERRFIGNRDLFLACRDVGGKIRRVHQVVAKSWGGNPPGRSYHASFGPNDKLMVFDVWTSQAAFDKFGKTLMPILQQLGIDPGQPSVMPVH